MKLGGRHSFVGPQKNFDVLSQTLAVSYDDDDDCDDVLGNWLPFVTVILLLIIINIIDNNY